MKEDNVIKVKSYAFAIRIVKAYKFLSARQKEFVLSKQMLRSGTAIGALAREAEYAQSKPDFISKFSIALKEANETEYWLMLLHDCDYLPDKSFESIITDCRELIKLLITIINSSKQSLIKNNE
jgi:four helix bundle protein